MTQSALGDKIGVSFQQVQKYEKGLNRIGAGRLIQIGRVLRVPVISLFEGVPDRSGIDGNARPATDLLAEPNAFRLAKAFAEVSNPGLRLSIVNLVEQIIRHERKP